MSSGYYTSDHYIVDTLTKYFHAVPVFVTMSIFILSPIMLVGYFIHQPEIIFQASCFATELIIGIGAIGALYSIVLGFMFFAEWFDDYLNRPEFEVRL